MEKSLTFNEAILRLKNVFNPNGINYCEKNELFPWTSVSENLSKFYHLNSDHIVQDIVIGLAEGFQTGGNTFFSYVISYDANFEDAMNIADLVTYDLTKLLNIPIGCSAVPSSIPVYNTKGPAKHIPIIEINVMVSEAFCL